MNKILSHKKTREECHVYQMLARQKKDKHLSFHTPGHKLKGWDITELSYSDNLSDPTGCILKAETDISKILGSNRSFILTDGSTSGILSALYAVKSLGLTKLAFPVRSHKSVYNACELLNLIPYPFDTGDSNGFPSAPSLEEIADVICETDGVLLTSPDYYGNIPDLSKIRRLCDEKGKFLLIDGAHGGHLHFDKTLYAGEYADVWVDGVHKSLPAFTQGAVVSARTETFATALKNAVDIFRTTSPSYPIMASVEYAVKYPKNETLEKSVLAFAKKYPNFLKVNEDWTKLCLTVKDAFSIQKQLEKDGFFPEFCDGETLMFYFSPATKKREFSALCKRIERLLKTANFPERRGQGASFLKELDKNAETEWVELDKAVGRICSKTCGLFPPCAPLIRRGEKIESEKIQLLKTADNVFGVQNGKIAVVKE